MSAELSYFELIAEATIVVKAVMLVLLLASIASWILIFIKINMLGKAKRTVDDFEEKFWSGTDLDKLFQGLSRKKDNTGLAAIFTSGYKEYMRGGANDSVLLGKLDMVSRSMRVSASREVDRLENSLSFLATVGSTSPYIGLFGTVWGIMNSFISLGETDTSTLAAVAPGIAEALIATAIGLFAAIPAVIAYNRFSDDVERLVTRYDNFVEEFTTLVQRQISTKA